MKTRKSLMALGFCAALALTACKSKHESSGDKFLEAGDPINALARYEMAIKTGKTSEEFHKNYTKANIMTMQFRYREDPSAEFLDILKDSIVSLLSRHSDAENQALFAQALYDVGAQRINTGDDYTVERGFAFLKTADSLPNKPAQVSQGIAELRRNYVSLKLQEIQSDYDAAKAGDPTAGITADYKLNVLAQAVGETPEMSELWSNVRQANLDTYLMYDQEGLLTNVDARINRYGVLLAFTKYQRSPSRVYVETMAFNGSTLPFTFTADGFKLVDKQGNEYEPVSSRGAFNSKKLIERGQQTQVGALTFKIPSDAEPAFIEFTSESGVSRKYLP